MFIKIRKLSSDDAGNDVGHTVVVANFFMLIPEGVFSGLSGPLSDLIGVFLGIGHEHTTGRSGDDLVAVEGNTVVVA